MRKGFTLIELIVVVIVIGILATFALPQYLKATERAKGAKAKNAMGLIASAEKMYRAENDTYIVTTATTNNTVLGSFVELSAIDSAAANLEWTINVSSATTSTFVIIATRISGSSVGTLTLNELGVWGGTGVGVGGKWTP